MDGRRVLIVEDNYLVAAGLSDVMVAHGATVVGPVSSVIAALEIIRREAFDGALLDVQLADGNCVQVATALIERNIPFVVVTGYERSTIPTVLRRAPYMGKPTAADDLVEVARATFRSPSGVAARNLGP